MFLDTLHQSIYDPLEVSDKVASFPMKYILSLDQGTTSSRAVLLNHRAQIVSMEQMEFAQHYPQPGWVEHDASDIWNTQITCAQNCLRKAGVAAQEVAAIGVTNQRETTVIWDRRTGEPVAPAIVWQDRRTAAFLHRVATPWRRSIGARKNRLYALTHISRRPRFVGSWTIIRG